MNQTQMLTPPEIVAAYSEIGVTKANKPAYKLILLGMLAGFIVGCGSISTNTAMYAIENDSVARLICGAVFPFALGIIMLIGAELFTGNTMIIVSVLERKTSVAKMLRNWFLVYTANFAGAVLLAVMNVSSGQIGRSNGLLAVYTIKTAAAKCSLSFSAALVFGILCNVLVCLGVLCSISAKDTTGRILGAYLPVFFFAMCGFEHSVANMYYIPAGLFAMQNSGYARMAIEAGYDLSKLTWGNFFVSNLLPVTIGNIIGGMVTVIFLWKANINSDKKQLATAAK